MSYLFHTVFISYSHHDSNFAKLIYELLTEIKLNVWMDVRSHEAGHALDRTLRTALERSRCVVHIASPHSRESKWVEAELAYAEELDLPIFSLLVDGDRLKSMPLISIPTIPIEAKGNQLLSGLQKLLKNIYNTLERHLLHSPLHQAQHLLRTRTAQNAEARSALYRRENNGQGYLSIVGVSGITLRLSEKTP